MGATTSIWYRHEINAIINHYPNMVAIKERSHKSAYKIHQKAEQLGLIKLKTYQPKEKKQKVSECDVKLWDVKRKSISEIENELALLESKISKGIDSHTEWNKTIQKYNALQYDYERAIKTAK